MPLESAQLPASLCVPKFHGRALQCAKRKGAASGAPHAEFIARDIWGDGMNGNLGHSFRRLLLAAALGAFCATFASAQAPTGPAPGGPPQQTPPPAQTPPGEKPQQGGLSIAVEVPVVTMDVVATTNHGDIITGLKRENFRLAEDGVPQTVTNFDPTDAPITMVVVMEFSARYGGWFSYVAKY